MKLLISNQELNSLKSRDFIPLICENCDKVFYKAKNNVQSSLKGHPNFALRFCSLKCHYNYQKSHNWINVECEECKITVAKQKSKITNNQYNFCSKSCSAKFQNKNKTLGRSKKSKSETYLANLIRKDFKNLVVIENTRAVLPSNLEIDIYVSLINLAIEINGPLHSFPIFGNEKLLQIKEKDLRKKIEAKKIGCKFLTVDISKIKYWKETKEFLDNEYCQNIKPLIKREIKNLGDRDSNPDRQIQILQSYH